MPSKNAQAQRAPITSRSSARLRILSTTDLHMNLCGFDYYADRSNPAVGLTRTASLIREARAETAERGGQCLLFDNGDGMQGTPMGDLAISLGTRPHPLMQAMRSLNYDAIGLGNHDFNFGLETLDRILRDAPCPVVASNLELFATAPPLPVHRSFILERAVPSATESSRSVRIGVLSVLPPQTLQWDAHLIAGKVAFHDMLDTARQVSLELRDAGCDIVIALAHSGLGPKTADTGMENIVHPLAQSGSVDVVIGGHTHLPFSASGDDMAPGAAATVLPGVGGSHLGIIDLDLTWAANTGWAIDQSRASLRPILRRSKQGELVYVAPEDNALTQTLAPAHTATRARMQEPVGQTDASLHSYFTFFASDRAMALVATAQSAAVQKILAGKPEAALPLLSAVAPGKFGGRAGPDNFTDISPGPMRLRNVADLHVYPNQLKAVVVSGQVVMNWLEMSASVFNQIPATAAAEEMHPIDLLCNQRAGHNFDVLHGLSYAIDLSKPARFAADGSVCASDARRVRDITWNGRPISADQEFVVATNSYRLAGGGCFPILGNMRILPLPNLALSDVIRAHIAAAPHRDRLKATEKGWRFVPSRNARARARVLTGPGAQKYLSELDSQDVVVEGITGDGFLSLILTL
ncbi:bifunctional 2',3'-cyclic-nucleotide 2'-phosphodiesterase/3'-nucleotidase [Rhodobacteraceae bacterium M382]|nr:bifunctional 2',3'-cyclic-nucleotide 2'-phosphodiesterase/3'-nucleotidase [Rhodobacteraceae bacterium M382]